MIYGEQVDAMQQATHVIRLLRGEVWGLAVTSDEDDAELNIYLKAGTNMRLMAKTLFLGDLVDEGEDFLSYKRGSLTVSLIEGDEDE